MLLITGAAGCIGSNLLARLQRHDPRPDIVIADTLGSGEKWRNIARHEIHDFLFPEQVLPYLEKNVDKIDVIFHLGAISSTTETDADAIVRANFQYSKALWDWAAHHGKRIIYASSAATYGDGNLGFEDSSKPEELDKLQPLNPYGWSKHAFDRYAFRQIWRSVKAPAQFVGLKFFNVYGPNEYHKGSQQSVIAHITPAILRGEPARLFKSYHKDYPDGGQKRDFIYVDDCVDVMVWFWQNAKRSGLFNVGTGQARTFTDLAKAVFAALGKPENIQYVPMPDRLQTAYQYYTRANMYKLKVIGYPHRFTPLEEGVKDYVTTYLAHANPYR